MHADTCTVFKKFQGFDGSLAGYGRSSQSAYKAPVSQLPHEAGLPAQPSCTKEINLLPDAVGCKAGVHAFYCGQQKTAYLLVLQASRHQGI